MDPLIFADPDPGSQNLVDPTDPDPQYCYLGFIEVSGSGKDSYGSI